MRQAASGEKSPLPPFHETRLPIRTEDGRIDENAPWPFRRTGLSFFGVLPVVSRLCLVPERSRLQFRMRLGSSPDDPTDRQIVRGNGEGLIARQERIDAASIAAVPHPGGTSSTGPVESWLPPLSGFAIAPSRSSGLPFPTPIGIKDNGGGELHPAREEV
jgi:hypothetical protein